MVTQSDIFLQRLQIQIFIQSGLGDAVLSPSFCYFTLSSACQSIKFRCFPFLIEVTHTPHHNNKNPQDGEKIGKRGIYSAKSKQVTLGGQCEAKAADTKIMYVILWQSLQNDCK